MLARLLSLRTLAMLLVAVPAVNLPSLRHAFAQSNEAEDSSDEGGEGEDSAAPDPNQPVVTAGGNYSLINTPQSEVQRTLIEPDGGLELRLDWKADLSNGQEFKTHTFYLLARYGITQINEARAGLDFVAAAPDGVGKVNVLHLEDEQALVFDLLDLRAGVDVAFGDVDTAADITAGLPFKYRLSDKIAVLGLERIIAIHTKGGGSPDFTLSVAGELQVMPKLVVIVRPQIFLSPRVKDAKGDSFKDLSIEGDVQYTIAPQFDIGFRLFLDNLTPPATSVDAMGAAQTAAAIDARGFAFYVRGRLPTK